MPTLSVQWEINDIVLKKSFYKADTSIDKRERRKFPQSAASACSSPGRRRQRILDPPRLSQAPEDLHCLDGCDLKS